MAGKKSVKKNALADLKVSAIASNPVIAGILKILDPVIEKLLSIDKVKTFYAEFHKSDSQELAQSLLEYVNTTVQVIENELKFIPKEGPVIIVANHPYGGIDGIILHSLLQKRRSDFKIMANEVLKIFPEFENSFIFVDAFNEKPKQNSAPLKQALRHLRNNGLLAIFPAGEVSSYSFSKKKVSDRKWNDSFARLASMTGAHLIPIHFSGRNSLLFQLAGIAHPMLRTALLPSQMMKKNRKIQVRIGQPVNPSEAKQLNSPEDLSNFLRLKTYLLSQNPRELKRSNKEKTLVKVAEETSKKLLISDIENLDDKNLLLEHKEYSVYYGSIEDFPNIILEIGRLREITFRAAGEGSGNEYDLDRFDDSYKHLIVWNNKKQEIVGSYRFALVDEIIKTHGIKGLYTSTFYKFSPDFKEKMVHGLELGRSFVRIEYQKKLVSLMLLWRGICRFVLNNPKYYFLFGAVSVSNNYDEKSRYIISKLLKNKSNEVTARKKYACHIKSDADVKALCSKLDLNKSDLVSNLIKTIEGDKDIPILLKQYMKLGGQFYSFTVDESFECLDGLVVVNLKESPKKALNVYMDNEIDTYLKHHDL